MATITAHDKLVSVVDLPQRLAAEHLSTYSNHVEIGTSAWDFGFLFFEVLEDPNGELIRERKARVVMTPQIAVAFSHLLNNTIAKWMKEQTSDSVENTE